MGRRQHVTLTIALGLLIFIAVSYLLSGHGEQPRRASYSGDGQASLKQYPEGEGSEFKLDLDALPVGVLEGDSIAPKLENATLKYDYAFLRN